MTQTDTPENRVMTHALDARIPLVSSLLVSMQYSPQATLDLEFHGGAVHRYFTVPRTIADGLRTAASKGAYFNRYIKDRFPSQRLV
jgi:lysyl-tRNA synthetase class 2